MKGKRYSEEQIVRILGEIDVGTAATATCRKYNVSEATVYRWRQMRLYPLTATGTVSGGTSGGQHNADEEDIDSCLTYALTRNALFEIARR